MRILFLILSLALLCHSGRAQDCDIATTGVSIVNAANTAGVSGICVGQQANFKFTIINFGSDLGCSIPANTVTAVFDFPTLTGGIKPYIYNGPASFSSGKFTWTYDSFEDILVGVNTQPIGNAEGDIDILVPVVGNAAGTGSSNLNITQGGGTSDNVGNNASGAQLAVSLLQLATCPGNLSVCPGSAPVVLSGGSPSGGTYSGSGVSSGQFDPVIAGPGAHVITYTYISGSGCSSSCSFTITVEDLLPPSITCPGPQNINLNATCSATVPDYTALAIKSDNCPGTITVTQSPAPGSLISGVGNQAITLTAKDASNNTATCSFILTKKDVTAPGLVCPGNQTLALNNSCTAILPDYTNLATTSDNCTGVVTVTQSPAAGTVVSGIGSTSVVLTAMDGSGNVATCSFSVNQVDITPPQITCPVPQTLALDGSCSALLPDYTSLAVFSDNCSGPVTVTQSPLPGTTISGVGVTTVTLTATDGSSNFATCSFSVNTVDGIAPQITCPVDQTITLDQDCSAVIGNYTGLATVSDNCSGPVTVIQSPAAGTIVSGVGVTLVTLTATDAGNNSAICTFNVNRVDAIAPAITCPLPQTLNLNATCSAVVPDYTGGAVVSDNCSAVTVTQSPVAGTLVNGTGLMSVTLTATDASNNSSTCSFTVTKTDVTAPQVTCPGTQTLALDGTCAAVLPDYTSAAVVSDNCSPVTVTQSPVAGTVVTGVGITQVTLTVTDASGNAANCNFDVNRVDVTAPSITCPGSQNLLLNASCSALLPDYTSLATTSDNCSGTITVTQVPSPGTVVNNPGTTVVTLFATDAGNNTASCSFNVNRIDAVPPTITCPGDQVVNLDNICSVELPDYRSMAVTGDNCSGVVSLTQNPAPSSIVSGVGTITVTITATDASNNTASCSFNVTKEDHVAPVISSCPSPVINQHPNSSSCQYITSPAMPVFTDNCGTATLTWSLSGPGAVAPLTGTGPIGSHAFGLGMTMISYVVTDASGNAATCNTSITVVNDLSGSVSGTTTVVQNNATTTPVTFSASGGTGPYTFTYSVNGGSTQSVTTTGSNTSVTVQQSNALVGVYTYTLLSVTDNLGCTGSLNTGTATITVVSGRPDLFTTIDRPINTQFTTTGITSVKEGYVTISNAATAPTTGTITLRISKVSNFILELLETTTVSALTAVNNGDWTITDGPFFYTLVSKPGVVINGSFGFSRLGFKLTATGSSFTNGIMTVTVINGTGGAVSGVGDSDNSNNQSVKLFTIN